MDNYFKKYKDSRILLLKVIETYESEERLNHKEDISQINEFDLNNIKNKENRDLICNILNIKKDILNKDDVYNIIKSIKYEHKNNIDYKKEYYKLLLNYISIIRELYYWKMSPRVREQLGMYPEYIDSDMDEEGNLITYYNFDQPLGNEIWEMIGLDTDFSHIAKSVLDEKEKEIKNKLKEMGMKI